MEDLKMSGVKWSWPPKFRKWGPRERANFKIGMFFLLPWTIGFLVFTLYPMVASFVYSFSIYHPKAPLEWIGLQNYAELLKDDLFWKSLYNTLYMVAIGVPLTLLASFFCAVLLNLKVRGQSIYRVIYFLPSIVPTVASTILWLWILNPNTGGLCWHSGTKLDEQPSLVQAWIDPFGNVGHGWDNCYLSLRPTGCTSHPAGSC